MWKKGETLWHVGMAYDSVSILRVSCVQVNAAVAGPAFICGGSEKKPANICSWLVKLSALSHMIRKETKNNYNLIRSGDKKKPPVQPRSDKYFPDFLFFFPGFIRN